MAEKEYIVTEKALADLQMFPFISGVALFSVAFSIAGGIYFGSLWIIPFGALALVELGLAGYAIYRSEAAYHSARRRLSP